MPTTIKATTVAEITELFRESGSFFVTDYQGLNVADISQLRKNLRENNVKYLVAKNTLFKLAAKQAGAPDMAAHFKGPTAVAFAAADASVAAKILYESFKEKKLPVIKAFAVEGQVHTSADVSRLAELPSRPVLLSMVVSAVESPLSSLVSSVDAVFQELIGTIDALEAKQKAVA
jgi:large subunit ribosomal protein L10